MSVRTALRVLAAIAGAFWLVVAAAPAAYACGLTYLAVDPAETGCASTAPALASAAVAVSALVATAVVAAGNYQAGAAGSGILEQAIQQTLRELDAQALAGAQNRLAATAASMGLPVEAFLLGHPADIPFQPTAQPLVSALRAYEGVRADYFRQLTLGQQAASYQTVAQLGQNLAVPQTRGSRTPSRARGRATDRLETSLTEAYQSNGASQADAKARAAYEANAVMQQLAVLHLPDLVAGGYDTATTLGLRSVNSSIGSQLRPDRLGVDLRAYVDAIPPQFRPTTLVNLHLRLDLA
ncbi:MAG: polymorphic toxin type 15 domain-containing protein [Geodermatophilaceae bacterium]